MTGATTLVLGLSADSQKWPILARLRILTSLLLLLLLHIYYNSLIFK